MASLRSVTKIPDSKVKRKLVCCFGGIALWRQLKWSTFLDVHFTFLCLMCIFVLFGIDSDLKQPALPLWVPKPDGVLC